MAGLQLSGLASGLDWKTLVDTLMDLERAPATRMEREKTTNDRRHSALTTLGGKLSSLRAATSALKTDGLFNGRTASVSGASAWTASAASGAATGSHTVTVSRLATAARLTGAGDIGRPLASSSNVSTLTLSALGTGTAVTGGVFTINGARVTVDVTDSLQDLFDAIHTATGEDVTASYDHLTDKITLTHVDGEPIRLGAANDTSNFLAATRLFNNGTGTIESASALGAANLSAPLADARLRTTVTAVDTNGVGKFSINGVEIGYDVDTDSLSTVIARINASTAGVTASFDRQNDRLVLTNQKTGDLGVTVSETAGGLLGALGLTGGTSFTSGQNALFTVDNGDVLTSASNTLSEESHGIAGLSLTVTTESTGTVVVGANTDAMRTKVDAFISAYNDVQDYIDEQSKITQSEGEVTTGTLSNNREVQQWAQQLRTAAFGAVSGLTGTISRLESLGIDFTSGTSKLEIKDATKLTNALTQKPGEVADFFGASTTGFAARLDTLFESYIGTSDTGGLLATQKTNLTNANKSLTQQIADLDRRLEMRREQMQAAFIAMEQAQSRLQQMQSQLTRAFSSSSSSDK